MRLARFVFREHALEHLAGDVLVNHISERTHQIERGGTYDEEKSHRGFGPICRGIVARDEMGHASGLSMYLKVRGERLQSGIHAT